VSAREHILQRVRAALGHGESPPEPLHPPPDLPPRAPSTPAPDATLQQELVLQFERRLAAVAGDSVRRHPDQDVADVVLERLRAAGARTVALGGGAAVHALAAPLGAAGIAVLPPDAPPDALFAADAGVTAAQWGIAETGTIALDADAARARCASLLPRLHLALLPCDRILASLDDLFAAVAGAVPGQRISHALTLVTGPSRTADIELQLVVGVHGPQQLFVVLT
jgi:L-lactate dehydrogenase complex protein LldG